MIANPDKFPPISLRKLKSDITDRNVKIRNQNIQVVSDIKMLEVHTDHKLNFDLHTDQICQTASNQLNALARLKKDI